MSDIRDKWQRLFDGDADDDLREELEQWAWNAKAGRLLDWVCVRSMGLPFVRPKNRYCGQCGSGPKTYPMPYCTCGNEISWWPHYAPKPSSDDADAMKVLRLLQRLDWQAIHIDGFTLSLKSHGEGARLVVEDRYGEYVEAIARADNNCVAIARAVGAMATRGIMLKEVNQ